MTRKILTVLPYLLKRISLSISNTYVHFSLLHLANCQEVRKVLSHSHFYIKDLDPNFKGPKLFL